MQILHRNDAGTHSPARTLANTLATRRFGRVWPPLSHSIRLRRPMNETPPLDSPRPSRRHFMQSAALLAGGFALGATLQAGAAELVGAAYVKPRAGQVPLNAWV